MWTQFWDMNSGGGLKEDWHYIYIEAPLEEAKVIFYNRFGHNPERVTCTCCSDDYSISEEETLEQITAFHRNCKYHGPPRDKDGLWGEHNRKGRYFEEEEVIPKGFVISHDLHWGDYQTLDDYIGNDDVLVIYDKDIKKKERKGDIPEQGYVWV